MKLRNAPLQIISIVGLSLLLAPLSLHSQGPETYPLTLEECIDYALRNNQNVLNSGLEAEKQKKVIGETLSQGLPQIYGAVDLRNNYAVPTSFIPAIFFIENAGPDDFVPVQFTTQYGGNASLNLTQMVFDGAYFIGVQAAKTFAELSMKDYTSSKIDVVEDVTKAFYAVLINEVGLDLMYKNYNRLDTLLRETQLMYQNGFAEKIDVNRIQVQFNNIKAGKRNSEELLALSYQLLKFQMGMPMDSELSLIGELSDLGDQLRKPFREDFVYSDRVEYSRLQTQELLAQYELRNTNSQYLPTLDFYLTGGANSGTTTLSQVTDLSNNWFGLGYFGLTMNIPIFDGLDKSYKIQQTKIKMHQIKNSFSLLENSIDLEIRTAKITLGNALRTLEAQEMNMKLSDEVFNVTKMKYQEGIGSQIEVIQADATYKEAQNNYFQSLYEVLIAKVELDKAAGVLYTE